MAQTYVISIFRNIIFRKGLKKRAKWIFSFQLARISAFETFHFRIPPLRRFKNMCSDWGAAWRSRSRNDRFCWVSGCNCSSCWISRYKIELNHVQALILLSGALHGNHHVVLRDTWPAAANDVSLFGQIWWSFFNSSRDQGLWNHRRELVYKKYFQSFNKPLHISIV